MGECAEGREMDVKKQRGRNRREASLGDCCIAECDPAPPLARLVVAAARSAS